MAAVFKVCKEKTIAAGNASKRAAIKAKLSAEIHLLHSKMEGVKKELGVAIWAPMVNEDDAAVKDIFKGYLERYNELEQQMKLKQDHIAHLGDHAKPPPPIPTEGDNTNTETEPLQSTTNTAPLIVETMPDTTTTDQFSDPMLDAPAPSPHNEAPAPAPTSIMDDEPPPTAPMST